MKHNLSRRATFPDVLQNGFPFSMTYHVDIHCSEMSTYGLRGTRLKLVRTFVSTKLDRISLRQGKYVREHFLVY